MHDCSDIFSGLTGGDRAKKILGASLRENRLVHNYLLEGPLGVGKFPFAIKFARNIICAQSKKGVACRKCDDCRLFDIGHHPDVLILSREAELTADEARRITELVMLTPQRAVQKIIILDEIDHMNPTAANILLKSFEDAPGGAIFISTTHRAEKLLPTILSRSLRVPFFLLPSQILAAEYIRILGVDAERAEHAAELSSGRPGWGIRFLIHPQFSELYDYGYDLVKNSLLKLSIRKIFHMEKLISQFVEMSAEIFLDQGQINGMDGELISRMLNGEKIDFNPVNFLWEEKKSSQPDDTKGKRKKTQRHLNALGFVLLGGIFRNLMSKDKSGTQILRYIPLMEAFLKAPQHMERYFNNELTIERFLLQSHSKLKI